MLDVGEHRGADEVAAVADALTAGGQQRAPSLAETPFGGVKDSGYGRESGTEGLYCYTVAKNVSHKMISS
jgi:succinate-semialdehyde dehydrogenase / glutarate-semialdehyde dehydrogenase